MSEEIEIRATIMEDGVEMLPKDPTPREIKTLSPVETITEGVMISAFLGILLGSVVYFGITGFFPIKYPTMILGGSFVIGLFGAVPFFLEGFKLDAVKSAHLAAYLFLGERSYSRQLGEGKHWTFPWFVELRQFSAEEVPKTLGDDKPFEVLMVGRKEGKVEITAEVPLDIKREDIKKDDPSLSDENIDSIVALLAKVQIRLILWNAPRSMTYPNASVWENTIGYVTTSVRHVGSRKGYMEFITNRHNVANEISRYFKRALHETSILPIAGQEEDKTKGGKESYWEQVEGMGYWVVDIELTKPDLSKDLKDAKAGVVIELEQRKRSQVRLGTFQEMFHGIDGLSSQLRPGALTPLQASNRALGMMDEEKDIVRIYEGVNGGGLIVDPSNETRGGKGGAA